MTTAMPDIVDLQAQGFTMGMGPQGAVVMTPGVVLISWKCAADDTLFQVYVNGVLAGVTAHPKQRQLLVDFNHQHAALIELRQVENGDQDEDWSDQLEGFSVTDGCHIRLRWPRLAWMPIGSEMWIYGCGGEETIDYQAEPWARVALWPSPHERFGWGLDTFGEGDFGYSATGAVGWGQGVWGEGDFGFDAEVGGWRSEELDAGSYRMGVVVKSEQEKQLSEVYETLVSIDPTPRARHAAIDSYDHVNNCLTLRLS